MQLVKVKKNNELIFPEPVEGIAEEFTVSTDNCLKLLDTLGEWSRVGLNTDAGEAMSGWIKSSLLAVAQAEDCLNDGSDQGCEEEELVALTTLSLGVNSIYRDALLKAQDITGIDAAWLAALCHAEALKDANGQWNAAGKNPHSSATGLTQFLKKTWRGHAKDPDHVLNKIAKARELISSANVIIKDQELLDLRKDPELSLISAAEFGAENISGLEKTGHFPDSLSDDEKARRMYMAHQQGLNGARRKFLNPHKRFTQRDLEKQVGRNAAQQRIDSARGDANKAFRTWFRSFIDQKIKPTNFRQPGTGPETVIDCDIGFAKVTAIRLNLRSTPDSSSDNNIIESKEKGIPINLDERVRVFGKVRGNPRWTKIEYKGFRGFVASRFLHHLTGGMSQLGSAFVIPESLNLRSAPEIDNNIIRALRIGDELTVLGEVRNNPRWSKVQAGAETGFVVNQYLRKPLAPEKEKLFQSSLREWERFDFGNGRETVDPYNGFIREMWESLRIFHRDGRTLIDPNNSRSGRIPWSAACISFMVKRSGAKYAKFKFHGAHSQFSFDAIEAREAGDKGKPFWGVRHTEQKPKVGDIVHITRGGGQQTYDFAAKHKRYASHSDIVIGITGQHTIVIGGNVCGDTGCHTVDTNRLELDANGFLKTKQGKRRVIALLKNRADAVS